MKAKISYEEINALLKKSGVKVNFEAKNKIKVSKEVNLLLMKKNVGTSLSLYNTGETGLYFNIEDASLVKVATQFIPDRYKGILKKTGNDHHHYVVDLYEVPQLRGLFYDFRLKEASIDRDGFTVEVVRR